MAMICNTLDTAYVYSLACACHIMLYLFYILFISIYMLVNIDVASSGCSGCSLMCASGSIEVWRYLPMDPFLLQGLQTAVSGFGQ